MSKTVDFYEELLSVLLDCGTCDISILADSTYDMNDMVEYARDVYGEVTLENLTYAVLEQGITDFEEAIAERIDTIESEYSDFDELMGGRTDEEYEDYICQLDDAGDLSMEDFKDMADILEHHKELCALKKLSVRQDTEYYFNCLDTSIYFTDNEEIYREYCKDMIEDFERNTGFSL